MWCAVARDSTITSNRIRERVKDLIKVRLAAPCLHAPSGMAAASASARTPANANSAELLNENRER
jgi:hypothetical protein